MSRSVVSGLVEGTASETIAFKILSFGWTLTDVLSVLVEVDVSLEILFTIDSCCGGFDGDFSFVRLGSLVFTSSDELVFCLYVENTETNWKVAKRKSFNYIQTNVLD